MSDFENLSWAQAWDVVGADADQMLSVTQAKLVEDAYDVEKTADDAVQDNDLTEVHSQGVQLSGETVDVLAGYRLIGETENPEVSTA